MDKSKDPEAAETVQTKGIPAVDLPRLVRRVDLMSADEIAAAIDASHPIETGETDADALAMKLVGERHGKRDLVDLVRWLLLEAPNDEARNGPDNREKH